VIRVRPIALVLTATLLAAGCGGGEGGESDANLEKSGQSEALPADMVSRADSNCRDFLREARRIGREAFEGSPPATILELATERLVKPSIPVLEGMAKRQQALESEANNSSFNLYAELFDPIVAIARERLEAGRAGDAAKAKRLEELLTNLGLEQRQAAREAGLGDCDIDFQHALLSSLNE
jgi:hypothetical protein